MGPVEVQFDKLRQKYPRAGLQPLPDGSRLITIPDVPLSAGRWNKPSTTVYFVVPVGYPAAKPDCFWTDGDLRLHHGHQPRNTGNQPLPGVGSPTLWFSWHATTWNPNTDNLRTYLRLIEDRLARAE